MSSPASTAQRVSPMADAMPPSGLRGRHGRGLGTDLLEAIFSRLSARELAAAELTCRQWRVPY